MIKKCDILIVSEYRDSDNIVELPFGKSSFIRHVGVIVSKKSEALKNCAQHFRDNDTDVIIYAGGIARNGYELFCKILSKQRRKNLLLVLSTFGGDPDAGYRIARAAIHHYDASNFTILVPKYCKSAGTLICIGANRLVMANQAELGPLDIQLRKEGELFQQSSGLDILRGMTYLQEQAKTTFSDYLFDINAVSGLSTKIASEIASKLVIGLYQPLFAQVDPVKLGEMSAALEIARRYGERLDQKSDSLVNNAALNNLIVAYPTHGFVIDRSEARDIFKKVDAPNEYEQILCDFVRGSAWNAGSASAIVTDFLENLAPPATPTESPEPPATSAPNSEESENDQPVKHEKSEPNAGEVSREQPDGSGPTEVHDQQHNAIGGEQSHEGTNESAPSSDQVIKE